MKEFFRIFFLNENQTLASDVWWTPSSRCPGMRRSLWMWTLTRAPPTSARQRTGCTWGWPCYPWSSAGSRGCFMPQFSRPLPVLVLEAASCPQFSRLLSAPSSRGCFLPPVLEAAPCPQFSSLLPIPSSRGCFLSQFSRLLQSQFSRGCSSPSSVEAAPVPVL